MSHTIHLQPVRLQPSGDDLQILIGWAKLLAKFIGREPLVIIRGGFVLLVIKQLAQSEFLLWAALKDQQHALHGLVGCSNSHIELWTGKGMRVSFQRNQAAFVHSLRDHRPLRDLLRARSEREGKKSAKKSSGRARGCVFPFSVTKRLSSTACVIIGRCVICCARVVSVKERRVQRKAMDGQGDACFLSA